MGVSVMIVDDDAEIRLTIQDVLEFEGYTVLAAENGKDALTNLESLKPSEFPCVIILDIMMPVMDGLTFLREIKTKPFLSQIPIIVSTAMRDESALGAIANEHDILKKPMNIDDILELVKKYCPV